VCAITEGLRQEAGDKLRVTIISPGFVRTDFAESMTNPEVKAQILGTMGKMAIGPDAIARAIAFYPHIHVLFPLRLSRNVTYVTYYDPGNAEDNEGDRARSFRRS
jgi:NAD(P)-dependent dehydrogenase (short-subunit alcohol dehydrogenase family)